MWCDSQPGSQPPFQQMDMTYLQGWELGMWGEGDIDRIICMSAKSQESG